VSQEQQRTMSGPPATWLQFWTMNFALAELLANGRFEINLSCKPDGAETKDLTGSESTHPFA
jgi:hypothetical protein